MYILFIKIGVFYKIKRFLHILLIIYYYYYCHKYILISYIIIDMKQSINQFIKNQQSVSLSKESKELIYKKVYQSIRLKWWLKQRFFSWSKYIWAWVVVVLCFSLLQYSLLYTPIDSLLQYFQWWMEAKADYIWVVVSWDGSYNIELNNKPVDLIESKNNIPVWSSLIVKKWSNIMVKTLDNTTTSIVWPAKITFSKNKTSNQIIIDVSYSKHIDIKKESVNQLTTNTQDLSLVVKTQQKTIVAKNEIVDFSLEEQWDNQIVVNNTGNIIISSDKNGNTLDLKPNQKTLLDAEIELFATNIIDTLQWEKTIISKSDLPWKSYINSQLINQSSKNTSNDQLLLPIDLTSSTGGEYIWDSNIARSTDSVSAILSFIDDNENNTIDSWSIKSSTQLYWKLIDQWDKDLIDEKNEFTTIKQQPSSTDTTLLNNESNQPQKILSIDTLNTTNLSVDSVDTLLQEKLLIDEELFWLLYHIYTNYNKEIWLSVLSNDILKVCKKISLSCSPWDSTKGYQESDYVRYIGSINSTLKKSYIITSDIHFILP